MEKIPKFKNYWIREDGRVLNGDMQVLKPYWGERDRCMYIILQEDGKRYLRKISTLMQITYFPRDYQYNKGFTLIPVNGDFRDMRLENLTPIPRGEAIVLKKVLLGESRYTDFYSKFMEDPTVFTFHSMPIDVQHYIKERVDIEWGVRTLGYPM